MLAVNLLGFRYHRTILESATDKDTASLKEEFDYSFVVSMSDFQDGSYEVVEKKSCLIDLSKGIDGIINSFSSTSRNEYRRSERISSLKFCSVIADFSKYYNFYASCERDRNWFPVPPAEFQESIVFSASYAGELISGMSCYSHGQRLRIGRIFSSKRSKRSEILNNTLYGSAAKRIIVEICKYGIEHGYKSLDLGGVDIEEASKSGIAQFKLSLGGDLVDVKLGRYMKDSFNRALSKFRDHGWDIT